MPPEPAGPAGVDVRGHGPRPVGPAYAGKSSHHGVHDVREPVAALQCVTAVARGPRHLRQLAACLAMDRGQVVRVARILDIRDIAKQTQEAVPEIELVTEFGENSVVVDIRSPDEEDSNPLELEGVEVIHIPFYKLATQFGDLPKDKAYLLYCDRGVMSRLQALFLKENGFDNVKVYRP